MLQACEVLDIDFAPAAAATLNPVAVAAAAVADPARTPFCVQQCTASCAGMGWDGLDSRLSIYRAVAVDGIG